VPASKVPSLTFKNKSVTGWVEFMALYSGATFNDGLYRVCRVSDLQKWTRVAVEGFGGYAGQIVVFAYDWLGRFYAVDGSTIRKGQPQILTLDHTTADAYGIPADFAKFHEQELVRRADPALAADDFRAWRRRSAKALPYSRCVDYKVPLFLAGNDEPSNMKVTDLELSWGVAVPMFR
jgi:hypothetical protein